jgi:hypothetical protein
MNRRKAVGPVTMVGLCVASWAVACASVAVPPPNDEWAAAQADIARAQAQGAPDVPRARLYLQLAHEDLEKSKSLMGADNRRASSLTALARAEAQLAVSLTKAKSAEDAASKARDELQLKGRE